MPENTGPESTGKAKPGRNQLGGFTVLRKLGAGAMGEVYEVKDGKTGDRFALKLLPKELTSDEHKVTRFRSEAKAAAKLTHPGIVTVHRLGEDKGRLFFVMDLVKGQSLDDILKKKEIGVVQAAKYVKQVAEALSHAHDSGVVHRDIKPSNLMVDENNDVFLADFGVAKAEGEAGTTTEGSIVGTPNYMSPEQARGRHDQVDGRSDIYSLGATFYEMLTRSAPFVAEHANAVLRKVMEDDPIPPSRINGRIPRALELICLKAMRKAPSKRYQDARDMARDIGRWLDGKSVAAKPESPAERALRWVSRHKGFTGGAAAVVLLVIVLSAVLSVSARNARLEKERALAEKKDQAKALLEEGDALMKKGEFAEARLKFTAALEKDDTLADAAVGLDRAEEMKERREEQARAEQARIKADALVAQVGSLADPNTLLFNLNRNVDGLLATEASITEFYQQPNVGDDYEGAALNVKFKNIEAFQNLIEQDTRKALSLLNRALLADPSHEKARNTLARLSAIRLKEALYYGRQRLDYRDARRWMRDAVRYNLSGDINPQLDAAARELGFTRQVLIEVSPTDTKTSVITEDLVAGTRSDARPMETKKFALAPGSYILEFWCEGYMPTRYPVYIPPFEPGYVFPPVQVRFAMMPVNEKLKGMAYIPGGKFLFGGPAGLRGGATTEVELEPYFIDRAETTNGEYATYLQALKDRAAPELAEHTPGYWNDPSARRDDLPVTDISWAAAKAYAKWAGKRLPTQQEWELAARGVDGRLYPWGNRFDETRCVHHLNTARSELSPPGSVENGTSPFGCLDMAGNVAEWTADNFWGYPIIRGGSFNDPFDILRTNARDCVHENGKSRRIGLRCAMDLR